MQKRAGQCPLHQGHDELIEALIENGDDRVGKECNANTIKGDNSL